MMHSLKAYLYDWWGANDWLFLMINSIHGDAYDDAMRFFSHAAERQKFPYYMGALVVFVLIMCARRAIGRHPVKAYMNMWASALVVLLITYGAMGVAIGQMKHYFEYPRPYLVHSTSEIRVLEYNKDVVDDDHRSFPSGHAAFATLMVMGLWPVLSSQIRLLGVLFIFAVCWSRLALGMHFPADTVYAVLLVTILVMIVREIVAKVLQKLFGMRS